MVLNFAMNVMDPKLSVIFATHLYNDNTVDKELYTIKVAGRQVLKTKLCIGVRIKFLCFKPEGFVQKCKKCI